VTAPSRIFGALTAPLASDLAVTAPGAMSPLWTLPRWTTTFRTTVWGAAPAKPPIAATSAAVATTSAAVAMIVDRSVRVAPVAAGHDPIRSTGLLLAHIENIASRTTPSRPQVWKLHGRTPQGQHPDVFLAALARRGGLDPIDLCKSAMPDRDVLALDPLSPDRSN